MDLTAIPFFIEMLMQFFDSSQLSPQYFQSKKGEYGSSELLKKVSKGHVQPIWGGTSLDSMDGILSTEEVVKKYLAL